MTADPADEADKVLDRVLLGEAFKQLADPDRAVILKAYYLGLTTQEIAAELNITDAVVKHRLHTALRFLRLRLIEPTHSDAMVDTRPPNLAAPTVFRPDTHRPDNRAAG
jgi:DNA-directed RNA polymerase specialized sigma24 family protein